MDRAISDWGGEKIPKKELTIYFSKIVKGVFYKLRGEDFRDLTGEIKKWNTRK